MNKYIIYQGSGGLVHLLGGLVYCCNYVKNKKGYKLIIDIKNHQAFGNYFKKYFYINDDKIKYSESYDIIEDTDKYMGFKLSELNKYNATYDPKIGYVIRNKKIFLNIGTSLENKNYNNNIKMYAGNGGNNLKDIIKYIKCNEEVKEKIKSYKINERYIGVHFRNTDRYNDIDLFISKLKLYKDYKIYIATDNYTALKKFKKELKDYNLFYYFEPFNANGKNIHFNDPDKDNVIMSILVDMYMLYNSEIFINSPNSLVSKLVTKMRLSKESIFD